jgi:phosphatidylinositol dimannoside acyltransferase
VRQLVAYLGFRVGIAIVGVLPRSVAIRLGELVASAVSPLFGARRRMALRHARRLGVGDPERHVRSVFAAYGRYWAETLWMRPRRRAEVDRTLQLDGEDNLVAAIEAGAGIVFALPHLGNWEFAGPIADRFGFELVAVAENLANRRLRDWFVGLRRQLGIG